jgi:hypothetical protein
MTRWTHATLHRSVHYMQTNTIMSTVVKDDRKQGHIRMLVQLRANVLSHVIHTLCKCSLDLLD